MMVNDEILDEVIKHLIFLKEHPVPIMPGTHKPKDGSTFGEEYSYGLVMPYKWPSYDMYVAAKKISESRYDSLLFLYQHRDLLKDHNDPRISRKITKFKPCWESELWSLFKEGILSGEFDHRIIKCEICGSIYNLDLHHILSVKLYPDQKFETTNISILCKTCHRAPSGFHGKINKKFHNINNQKEDIERFNVFKNTRKCEQTHLTEWMVG